MHLTDEICDKESRKDHHENICATRGENLLKHHKNDQYPNQDIISFTTFFKDLMYWSTVIRCDMFSFSLTLMKLFKTTKRYFPYSTLRTAVLQENLKCNDGNRNNGFFTLLVDPTGWD